jgi:hypothetical protein
MVGGAVTQTAVIPGMACGYLSAVGGFRDLAAQLGALGVADTRNAVDSVHGVLAAYPRQWLLLFDNAPDRASVEEFLPQRYRSSGSGVVDDAVQRDRRTLDRQRTP